MLFFRGFSSLTDFLVIIRSVNIFVFDWLTITKETHLEVDSYSRRNKSLLGCDSKLLSRNVIIQVILRPTNRFSSASLNHDSQIVHINQEKTN